MTPPAIQANARSGGVSETAASDPWNGATPQKYRHIAAGVDFSSASRHAMKAAARMAALARVPLEVLHVMERGIAGGMHGRDGFEHPQPALALECELRTLFAETGEATCEAHFHVGSGDPHHGLTSACKDKQVDLLVLGSRGIEHCAAYPGTTAAKCLHQPPADVLLIREGAPTPVRKVLVGVDFHPASLVTVAHAARFALAEGAVLECLHVHVPPNSLLSLAALLRERILEEDENINDIEHQLDAFVRPLLSAFAGLAWTSQVREADDVRRGILASLKDSEADVMALGAHGRSGMLAFFVGTAAEIVIQHTRCSILAVKI